MRPRRQPSTPWGNPRRNVLKDAKEVGVGRGLGQRPSRTISTRFTQPQNRPVVLTLNYFPERCTNLASPLFFTPLATDIPGQPGTTSYPDTNATNTGPYFYRVGVGN